MSKFVSGLVVVVWMSLMLAGCGGGGSDESATTPPVTTPPVTIPPVVTNVAPVANAGVLQNVSTGTTVTLNGSASTDANADPLTYLWTLTSRPVSSSAVLSNPSSATPSFTADAAGTYVATLVVNDGKLSSTASTVTVTATTVITNAAPVANAGPAQNVVAGAVVTLDGSASSDANGDPITYGWVLTSRPAGSNATLGGAGSARPSFTTDLPGTYVASLVVSDGKVGSAASTVTVTAAVANVAPVASAGTAQNVFTGSTVTLDGSGSSDANGDTLTYVWTLTGRPSGSRAVLSGASSLKPTFSADAAGTYVATLVVNDGKVSSAPSTVTVTAALANLPPVANAGPAQNVATGTIVVLDGSASTDPNGDPITFGWTLVAIPVGSTTQLGGAGSTNPSFFADVDGTYVARLTVADGRGGSSVSTVTVTATTPPRLFLFTEAPSGDTPQSLPYSNGAGTQTANVVLGDAYVVARFKLVATLASFTIKAVSAVDDTGTVVPSFAGIANDVVVTPGQPISFSLKSPLTGGVPVSLRYSFQILETGATFAYTISLTTN